MPKRKRKSVGEFSVGEVVLFDGELYRIDTFVSRRTVKVQAVGDPNEVFQVSRHALKKVADGVDNS